MDQLNTQFQKHLCFSFLIKYDWKFTPHGEIFFTIRCKNTPNSVKVDFYTSKCKKKVKFNRKIVSLVGESFYTKGCKSVKVNFYTLWCNGQHSKEYPEKWRGDYRGILVILVMLQIWLKKNWKQWSVCFGWISDMELHSLKQKKK